MTMELKTLITECTAYDFKLMLEEKKPKSWLKSVSAFVRVGDESLPATAEQMVRLVLKDSNKTFDSLHTYYKVEDYSFTILGNTFKLRTSQEWNKKYLLSFGFVTGTRCLTNLHQSLCQLFYASKKLLRILVFTYVVHNFLIF